MTPETLYQLARNEIALKAKHDPAKREISLRLPKGNVAVRRASSQRFSLLVKLASSFSKSVMCLQSATDEEVVSRPFYTSSSDLPWEAEFGDWIMIVGPHTLAALLDTPPVKLIVQAPKKILDDYGANYVITALPDNLEWVITYK